MCNVPDSGFSGFGQQLDGDCCRPFLAWAFLFSSQNPNCTIGNIVFSPSPQISMMVICASRPLQLLTARTTLNLGRRVPRPQQMSSDAQVRFRNTSTLILGSGVPENRTTTSSIQILTAQIGVGKYTKWNVKHAFVTRKASDVEIGSVPFPPSQGHLDNPSDRK